MHPTYTQTNPTRSRRAYTMLRRHKLQLQRSIRARRRCCVNESACAYTIIFAAILIVSASIPLVILVQSYL